nr:MFS transporter [Pseudomonas sp.]
DPERELFAPAIAITALDMLFKVGDNAWRAVADLALYGLIAFALYALLVAIRWPIERRLRQRRAEGVEEDSRTLRERMQEDDAYPAERYTGRVEPRL